MIFALLLAWGNALPKRFARLFNHFLRPWKNEYTWYMLLHHRYLLFIIHFVFEIPLLVFDILGIPEWVSCAQSILKKDARELLDYEIELAREIFKDNLNLAKVRVDQNSKVGTHGGKYAFVTFYYINCIGHMRIAIVIHELVHILQFEQDGSRYAFRNVIAHLLPKTYDYGGIVKIKEVLSKPSLIHSLNYEQRADIFSDYCLLLNGYKPEWGNANSNDLIYYYKIIQLLIRK